MPAVSAVLLKDCLDIVVDGLDLCLWIFGGIEDRVQFRGEARAAYAQAQAELRLASSNFDRIRNLVAGGSVARKEEMQARAELEKARAALDYAPVVDWEEGLRRTIDAFASTPVPTAAGHPAERQSPAAHPTNSDPIPIQIQAA